MKIADYSLAMQSSHNWSQQTSVKETLRVWVDPPAPPPSPQQQVTISSAAIEQQAGDAAAIDNAMSAAQNDPRLRLLILMIEKMTGQKVRLFDASQLKADHSPAPSGKSSPAPASNGQSAPSPRAGYGVDYSKVTSYSESEQTTMQASGVIKTTDGKEIKFDLNLVMQRQYSETSTTSVKMGDATRKATDPLVINFDGTAAQLSDQRFAFDLNSDGKTEQINSTLTGSGFLALDKNNDGKINNGSELFGPTSGNGFSDLAQYDGDHNGWIDENDAVFNQLKVWTDSGTGNGKLSSLASLGVGAISTNSIATPFDIKTATNQLLGSVRSTGVVLNENGSVGSVQQIDLTV
jgi:hypothetical protein